MNEMGAKFWKTAQENSGLSLADFWDGVAKSVLIYRSTVIVEKKLHAIELSIPNFPFEMIVRRKSDE